MKWSKPELYDLSDPKGNVAQGACAFGDVHDGDSCGPGQFADSNCINFGNGLGVTLCNAGSAAEPV
jgi:hypothetical protein